MLPAMMKRRDALKKLGEIGAVAGAAALLPGCGGGNGDTRTPDAAVPAPDAPVPDARPAPVGITTYVYMMMENRSYDHFFGARSMLEGKPGDGPSEDAFNKDKDGDQIKLWPATKDTLCDLDPPHGWDAAHLQWNNGMNDGFVTEHQKDHPGGIEPMQYITRTDVPVTYALADQYATADRWFCSVMGPTWPNRFYWHTGTSGGLQSNIMPPNGIDWPSIYHRLDAKGIDWGYYYGNVPLVATFKGLDVKHIHRFSQFLSDAAAGTLPPVVYIDPAYNDNDDHPPVHPINGQELISAVYKALAASPQWQNCMLVITYDENGGFYDHVSPPKTVDDLAAMGFDQMGFRVPTLVAGPYVKEGHLSSVVYDHCSALRHLEKAFDLEPLNQRTIAANDLSDFIDAERLAAGDWKPPIEIPVVDVTEWPMSAVCTGGSLLTADHDLLAYFDAHPEVIAGLDLRPERAQYRQAIHEFLAAPPRAVVK
jgi:phospholipase C